MAYANKVSPDGTRIVGQGIDQTRPEGQQNFIVLDPELPGWREIGTGISPCWLTERHVIWAQGKILWTYDAVNGGGTMLVLAYSINGLTANGAGEWCAYCAPGPATPYARLVLSDGRQIVDGYMPALSATGELAYITGQGLLFLLPAGAPPDQAVLIDDLAEFPAYGYHLGNELGYLKGPAPPKARPEVWGNYDTCHLLQPVTHEIALRLEPTRLVLQVRGSREGWVVGVGVTKDPHAALMLGGQVIAVTYEAIDPPRTIVVRIPVAQQPPLDLWPPVPPVPPDPKPPEPPNPKPPKPPEPPMSAALPPYPAQYETAILDQFRTDIMEAFEKGTTTGTPLDLATVMAMEFGRMMWDYCDGVCNHGMTLQASLSFSVKKHRNEMRTQFLNLPPLEAGGGGGGTTPPPSGLGFSDWPDSLL